MTTKKPWKLSEEVIEEKKMTLGELLRDDKVMVTNLGVMITVWSFASFAFFLVPYYLSNVGKNADIYVMSLATEFAEFLASVICIFITRILKLKTALTLFTVLVLVSATLMMVYKLIFEDEESGKGSDMTTIIDGALIMLCNLGVVCAFDIAYLINVELFPTIVLATAYGACNAVGRFISIFAPVSA